MLKISVAAVFAAVLSLSAAPAVGIVAAAAQETSTTASGFTSSLSIPSIVAVDSSMDETALRDALSGGFAKHVDELATLSATSITIPEITLKMTVTGTGGPTENTMVYKDIVLNNVEDGVAESASIGSATTTSPEGEFTFGEMSTSTLDIGGILALYSAAPAGDAGDEMRVLYQDFSFEGGSLTGPQAQCTFGPVTTAEFDARPLKVSFGTMLEIANKLETTKADPAPEDIATFVTFMTDIFQAFKSEPLTMDGLSCTGTGEDGKAFEFSIGGVTMDGYAPGIYPALTLSNIEISSGDEDHISLGEMKLKSIDLSAPIETIGTIEPSTLTPVWFQTNARLLIPAFGGFSLSGLDIDIPNPDKPGERITAAIGDFDLSLGNYVNGIPTEISTSASGVDVPLPKDSTEDSVKMLLALGIDHVNLGYRLDAAWDQASQTINVTKVSVTGEDLGSFAIAAVIGNAADQLFAIDPNVALAASMGVTVKNITVDVTDEGLGDLLVPMLAAQQNTDAATFRTQMAGVGEGAALQMLGSTDAARQLGAAIGSFIGGTATALSINIAAKDPAGLPVPVLMQASENPMVLTTAVDVTGTAK